jgi:hypothetical protein
MEVDFAVPRIVHALRWSPQSSALRVEPVLGGITVYEPGETKGRATVSQIAAEQAALAVLNADFFPWTGDPEGLMVRAGRLVSGPSARRAVFAWGPKTSTFGTASFRASADLPTGEKLSIEVVNQEVPLNRIALNGPDAGTAVAKSPSIAVILKTDDDLRPSTALTATVELLQADFESLPVANGTLVLVAQGAQIPKLAALRPGDTVRLDLRTDGFDWESVENAVGGGPFLLRGGEIATDWKEQGFNEAFSLKRHPRTAIGLTPQGDVWLVAIDGRQPMSVGATLEETARVLLRLGCRDAINLDGGGSTALNLLGVTVNRPSDGRERPVANAVAIFGPQPESLSGELRMVSPATLTVGETATLRVFVGEREVESARVLWSCMGAAWIDQGGVLRPHAAGEAKVTVSVGGKIMTATVTILPLKPG